MILLQGFAVFCTFLPAERMDFVLCNYTSHYLIDTTGKILSPPDSPPDLLLIHFQFLLS